jgi:hypothetical protein
MKGIHKKTGVVLNLPLHNLYAFNEEGKITARISYFNNDVFEEIANSRTTQQNGEVYINHPHIVTVRKVMKAFVARDLDEWASYFIPEAGFTTSSLQMGESLSIEEYKKVLSDRYFKDNLKYHVEQVGYPDCIFYEKSNQYVVYSWWKMVTSTDGKKYEFPFMVSCDFDKKRH